MEFGADVAGRAAVGYATRMLSRTAWLAMLFATVAAVAAQQQEQRMMDRIMNPDRDRANPMGAKEFSAKPFEGREFRGAREYAEVKPARTKEFGTREFLGIRNPWFGKKVHATVAAREVRSYSPADRDYSSRAVETRTASDGAQAARVEDRMEAEAGRAFLGRGKAQGAINTTYPSPGPMTVDEVRDMLNRPR